jgi:small nuclear ribonucleoprotein (snRNP)-like protein
MTLTDELKNLVDHEIAIVMNDGMTFRGKLIKYDEETIVIDNVYEAPRGQVDWIKSADMQNSGGSTLKGYLQWRKITLPKLLARTDRILRIWPWVKPEKDENSNKDSS